MIGWGRTESVARPDKLQELELKLVDRNECQSAYLRAGADSKNFQISPRQMCADGDFGSDSCKGDSGGPLLYGGGNDRYLHCHKPRGCTPKVRQLLLLPKFILQKLKESGFKVEKYSGSSSCSPLTRSSGQKILAHILWKKRYMCKTKWCFTFVQH